MSHLPEWASTKWLQRVAELQPEMFKKFVELEEAVYEGGALPAKTPAKTKELIAVAVTHVRQCDACMEYHTTKAKLAGATDEEIVEALFVAMKLRARATLGHHAASARAVENHHRQQEKESAATPAARAGRRENGPRDERSLCLAGAPFRPRDRYLRLRARSARLLRHARWSVESLDQLPKMGSL